MMIRLMALENRENDPLRRDVVRWLLLINFDNQVHVGRFVSKTPDGR